MQIYIRVSSLKIKIKKACTSQIEVQTFFFNDDKVFLFDIYLRKLSSCLIYGM